VGTVAGEDIGILSLNTRQFPEVEIDSFGILPGLIGRGIGRIFLSEALDTIWADSAKRIWLHTSSDDHPNALRNYLARGFRVYEP
jgi:ribosomal protein S18 acetylase RimI-like enzyme